MATKKINLFAAARAQMKAWQSAAQTITAGLDPTLVSFVEIRSSQINGCASCLNMHTVFARERGESEQRLYLLAAWREAPCYTDRERAALEWTEALTRMSEGMELEQARTRLAAHFSEEEQVKITLMVNIINGWNRLVAGFGLWVEPDSVRPMVGSAQ